MAKLVGTTRAIVTVPMERTFEGNPATGRGRRHPKAAPTELSRTQLEAWEGEGGAPERLDRTGASLRGTVGQVEWALRIKHRINLEFDRVGAAFRVVAGRQKGQRRNETVAIIDILEEKRLEVIGNEEAGYFIRGWQEIGDQVRQLIFEDARYQAIRSNWPFR